MARLAPLDHPLGYGIPLQRPHISGFHIPYLAAHLTPNTVLAAHNLRALDHMNILPGGNYPKRTWPPTPRSSTPGLLPKGSASTADWAFSAATWILTPAQFHSPPTSITGTVNAPLTVTCNLPQARNLPSGRFATWLWYRIVTFNRFHFRSQVIPPYEHWDDRYLVVWDAMTPATLEHWGPSGDYLIGSWPVTIPFHAWRQLELTWHSGLDPAGDPALCVQLRLYTPPAWQDFGYLYDPADLHADSPINGVGFYTWNDTIYIDDTQIWRPA